MPAIGEEKEEGSGRPESNNGVIVEAERLHQAAVEENVSPVEGAHSDEVRSIGSGSDDGSRGGNRMLPPLLGDFDVHRFKSAILEVVEELRMRRVIDAENEERIKSLITEKQDLELKLEEEHANYETKLEGHTHSEQEMRKSYEEQLKQAEKEVTRSKLAAEGKELEAKALKDEIRSLHMSRYNLEKKVQEQERQLHLQGSSRENYLSQVNQLEQNCLSVSRQANEVTEHMERLEANVKQAMELQKKLEYVNEHQKCELKQSQEQLEQCRKELLDARVKINCEGERSISQTGGHSAKTKVTSHELRLQVELNHQLQEQLSALREEHQNIILQLKEAHSIVERHIETSTKLSVTEVVLQTELRELRETNKTLQQKLTSSQQLNEVTSEAHMKELTEFKDKCCDLEQRLKTLQGDYTALQQSHDQLEEAKVAYGKEVQTAKEDLEKVKDELLKTRNEIQSLNRDKDVLNEKMQQTELKGEKQMAYPEKLTELENCESAKQKEELQMQPLVTTASQSTTARRDCSEELSTATSSAAAMDTRHPSLSPVFSPEVILISPPSAKPISTDFGSPPQRGTENCDDLVVPVTMCTSANAQTSPSSLDQPFFKPQLRTEITSGSAISSSTNKRRVDHDSQEDDERLSSPEKKPKLDTSRDNDKDKDKNDTVVVDKVTKVDDSPLNAAVIKNELVMDKDIDRDSTRSDKDPQVKKEDVRLEEEDTKNTTACVKEETSLGDEMRQIDNFVVSEDKKRISSQGIARLSFGCVGDQSEPAVGRKTTEPGDPAINVMFSDNEDEGGANGRQTTEEKMLSSQMNRQIDRVQMFLKLERLRRPKK